MVETAKSRHFQHTINNNSNDPKQLWKGVNLIRGKGSKTTNITSLEVEKETITGNKNIAEALNSFFVNVGPSLSKELPESQNNYADYLQYFTQNAFTFDEVSENDTQKLQLEGIEIRTREKPGLVLGLAFKKPGLDNRKPGLQNENTGFDETGF